jgi:hypothetical protein
MPFLAACDQTFDLYFYPDETWQVKSVLTFSPVERKIVESLEDEFVDWVLDSLSIEARPRTSISKDAFGGLLDLLASHYGNLGIDFRWKALFGRYTFTIKGQTLEQFEQLVPGAISLEELDNGQYHLNIALTDMNTFATLVYKQKIVLHAGKIISHNAPRSGIGSVIWQNPKEVDAVFEPQSSPSWLWFLTALVTILIIVAVVVFIIKRRSSHAEEIDFTDYDIQR